MARIRFKSAQVYDTGGPGKGPKFDEGFVLDEADVGKVLSEDVTDEYALGFLDRWVRRGVAEYVDGRSPSSLVEDVKRAEPMKGPVIPQPLGTESRDRATVVGLDDGKQVIKADPAPDKSVNEASAGKIETAKPESEKAHETVSRRPKVG